MGVQLREKAIGKGKVSMYLDIYHNKQRWTEFLKIHISKTRPTEADKEKRRLALEIKVRRENELIIKENDLPDRSRRKADFVAWYEGYINGKRYNSHAYSTLRMLQRYLGKQPLPFTAINQQWIKGFINFMLTRVSNNTAICYLTDVFTALEDAVIADIIPANPIRKIPRHERMKKQDIFRHAYTLEDLQILVNTPCNIEPQIKEGFLFGCFTGLRWSDVNKLKWSEVIIKQVEGKEEYFIYFEQKKTAGVEYLPLSDQAVDLIKARQKARSETGETSLYVFPQLKEYNPKLQLMHQPVPRALGKGAKEAGFDPKRMHFHISRHTFATNVLESSPDGDLYTVSKLLGHKSIVPTQVYAHVRDTKKAIAVKSLPKLNLNVESWNKNVA